MVHDWNVTSLLGAGLITMITPDTRNADIYGFSVLMGVGSGLTTQLVYEVAQDSHPKRTFEVIAFLAVGQAIGAGVGVDLATSIFMNLAAKRIGDVLPNLPKSQINNLVVGTDSSLARSFGEGTQK